MPGELIGHAGPEAATLAAVADAVSLGELAHGGPDATFEYFRETPHAAVLGEVAAELARNRLPRKQWSRVFTDCSEFLRSVGVREGIKTLTTKQREVGLEP